MSSPGSACGCRAWCMADEHPAQLTATEAARRIAQGRITAEELVSACLERIRQLEPAVQAWQFLDEAHALSQARSADERRRSGEPVGALCGIPVGVKDIIDTADMPTENGTVLDKGRMPRADAAVVARLRAAGGVIMGKTVSTECAYFTPGKTRNPHNPEHTPGGSSSGSAAAVAAHMVPLALGSQTAGSVIRPGAFCGVYAMKPTHGLIPRTGVLQLSRTLDHVGLFARSLDDLALLATELAGHDEGDADTRPRARIPFEAVLAAAAPVALWGGGRPGPRRWSRCSLSSRRRIGRARMRTPRTRTPSWCRRWATGWRRSSCLHRRGTPGTGSARSWRRRGGPIWSRSGAAAVSACRSGCAA